MTSLDTTMMKIFPDTTELLENGNVKWNMGKDLYCVIPKGYTEPNYSGFFDMNRECTIKVEDCTIPECNHTFDEIKTILEGDLSRVRDIAIPVKNIYSFIDCLAYQCHTGNDLFKLDIPFGDLTSNLNMVTDNMYRNILCIEGLDADIESGTCGNFHLSKTELFPVFMSATAFNDTRFKNVDDNTIVTCYFISWRLRQYLGMSILTLGRFTFGSGMLRISEGNV